MLSSRVGRSRRVVLFVPAIVVACGGSTLKGSDAGQPGVDGASSGGFDSGSGSGSDVGPVDAEPVTDAVVGLDSPPPVMCRLLGGNGGGGTCPTGTSEMCTDGNVYGVSCRCSPSPTCSCVLNWQDGGASISSISYAGCPGCSTFSASDLYSLCGFPQ